MSRLVTITDRDEAREGDVVTYGALGYIHKGTLVSGRTLNRRNGTNDYVDDDLLAIPDRGTWYADFIVAHRGRPPMESVTTSRLGVSSRRKS